MATGNVIFLDTIHMNNKNHWPNINQYSSNTMGFADPVQDKEVSEILQEAYEWVDINNPFVLPEEDDSYWKIKPIGVCNPKDHKQWNNDRIWFLDAFDGMLGDDAMPGKCITCHGIFWGEDLISIRAAIDKLKAKHKSFLNNNISGLWEDIDIIILEKLRAHRQCKKCFNIIKKQRISDSYKEDFWSEQHNKKLGWSPSYTTIKQSSSDNTGSPIVSAPTVSNTSGPIVTSTIPKITYTKKK